MMRLKSNSEDGRVRDEEEGRRRGREKKLQSRLPLRY